MSKAVKKLLQYILLLLGGLCISLILAEIGIRIFAPQPRYYAPQYLFKADELLGYKLAPNFSGFYSTPETKVRIQINSKGLRDHEHEDKNGIRILGLGDSFVMGGGVELEETFLCILEKYLNQDIEGHRFDVINAGVQGYGTDQELTYLKTSGLEYRPDLVILGFYPNDIVDNLLPNFTVKDGYLFMEDRSLSKEHRRRSFIDYRLIAGAINNKVHLFRFIINRSKNNPAFGRIFLKSTDRLKKTRKKRIAIYEKVPNKKIQEGWEITRKILKDMRHAVRANNSELLIVYIPERFQVYKKQWGQVKKQWELNDDSYDISTPNKILSDFCKENNIPFLDLLPELRNHVERGEELYYRLDPHLTAKGNEVVAKAIYKMIIQGGLVHAISNKH